MNNKPIPSDEFRKMIAGEEYSAIDPVMLEELNRVKDLCWEYNQLRPTLLKERHDKLQEIHDTYQHPCKGGRRFYFY